MLLRFKRILFCFAVTKKVVQIFMYIDVLFSFGSEKLKQEFLVPSIAGERVSCIGISEPDHGSDVAGIIQMFM